ADQHGDGHDPQAPSVAPPVSSSSLNHRHHCAPRWGPDRRGYCVRHARNVPEHPCCPRFRGDYGVNWGALAAMLGIHVAGMTTPGPDIFLILRTALRSRKHALAAVAGIVTGSTLWVTLTVVGVAAVLATHPVLMGVIQLAGGAYLTWMASRMISGALRGLRELSDGGQPALGAAALGSVWSSYRQGVLTNLSNPKIVL